jgi:hypothetical protein
MIVTRYEPAFKTRNSVLLTVIAVMVSGYLRVRVASRDPVVLRVDGTFTDQRTRSEIASAWVWRRRTRFGVVFERNASGP